MMYNLRISLHRIWCTLSTNRWSNDLNHYIFCFTLYFSIGYTLLNSHYYVPFLNELEKRFNRTHYVKNS